MPDQQQLKTAPIELHERRITLEDGRYMVFFTFTDNDGRDLSEGLHPWTKDRREMRAMSELRYNPLLGEWLATATQRQDRTFLPPADFCPLCPTKPGKNPTEVPEPNYDLSHSRTASPVLGRSRRSPRSKRTACI